MRLVSFFFLWLGVGCVGETMETTKEEEPPPPLSAADLIPPPGDIQRRTIPHEAGFEVDNSFETDTSSRADPPYWRVACDPRTYSLRCVGGSLLFCPHSGFVSLAPLDLFDENEFCVEGMIQECETDGWRAKPDGKIQNQLKWKECLSATVERTTVTCETVERRDPGNAGAE